MNKICNSPNCRETAMAKGLCKKHYRVFRIRRHFDLGDICSIEECNRGVYARGWCFKHYNNWLRCGDPLGKRYYRPKICLVKECARKNIARGLCKRHYSHWRKYGDPLHVCVKKVSELNLVSSITSISQLAKLWKVSKQRAHQILYQARPQIRDARLAEIGVVYRGGGRKEEVLGL